MFARKISARMKITILFGTVFAKIATIAFCVGILTITELSKDTDFSIRDWRNAPSVIGTIISVEKTNSSVNNVPIYKYTFIYSVQGFGFEDCSFGTRIFTKGEHASIEYLINEPSKARIIGLSESKLHPFFALGYSIFLIPFFYIYKNHLKVMSVLKYGIKVKGKLIKKEKCRPPCNSSSFYYLTKYHFQFVDQNGKQHTIVDWSEAPNYFEKTKDATILFDPLRPERAKALSLMGGAPLTVTDTEIQGEHKLSSLLTFLLVVLSCLFSVYNLLAIYIR